MAKVMDSFIAAIPDVLTPQGETINAVDLPSYLWSRMARASESNANDEPLQVGLIALWDASLAYLRGGRISWVAPRRYLPEEAGLREPTSNRRARSLSARRIKPPQSWSVRLVRSGCTRIRSGFSVPGARQETFLEEEAE
jgi:hypothetical protein